MTRFALRPLQLSDEEALLEAQRVMAPWTFAFDLDPNQDFARYVTSVASWPTRDEPGRVPSTYLIATVDGVLAGRLSVRHRLNDFLLLYGGHLGYGVLPQFRRQGLATWMLQRGLERIRALGESKALVTCGEDNPASRRIIEHAGGVYESSVHMPTEPAPTRRYWFDLAGAKLQS